MMPTATSGRPFLPAPWIAFNFAIYGKILSHYYFGLSYSRSTRFAEAAAGNLVSPARGLFVYSPVLLFSLSGFVLSLRDKEQRALHLAYGIIVAGMFIAISLIPAWWAGHSFGPRYMTDLLPFLVYFTAFNFNVAASWRPAVMTAMGVLVAISVAIHAQGALRGSPWRWNATPRMSTSIRRGCGTGMTRRSWRPSRNKVKQYPPADNRH
jgi:succinate dehydrogenase/fumarate reductase cytochrome b subunit